MLAPGHQGLQVPLAVEKAGAENAQYLRVLDALCLAAQPALHILIVLHALADLHLARDQGADPYLSQGHQVWVGKGHVRGVPGVDLMAQTGQGPGQQAGEETTKTAAIDQGGISLRC